MLETRISNSFCTVPNVEIQSALLVRIYPQKGIGEPFELSGRCLSVGRDDCDLKLVDDSVSRRHAMIDWKNGCHILADMASTNGTFVNENRITQQELRIGDRIRFGNQIFKYLSNHDIESQYHEVVYKIMTTDGLTQAYNKRYFLESLERELEHSQRSGDPLSVMILDLDHFKSVNDTYGHLAGDVVLSETARLTRSVLRSGEIFARFGGEEFVILCSRTTAQHAAIAAERVRAAIAAKPIEFESHFISVTASIGISTSSNEKHITSRELLEDADNCLYVAKNSGRNQIQFARGE